MRSSWSGRPQEGRSRHEVKGTQRLSLSPSRIGAQDCSRNVFRHSENIFVFFRLRGRNLPILPRTTCPCWPLHRSSSLFLMRCLLVYRGYGIPGAPLVLVMPVCRKEVLCCREDSVVPFMSGACIAFPIGKALRVRMDCTPAGWQRLTFLPPFPFDGSGRRFQECSSSRPCAPADRSAPLPSSNC